MSIILPGLSINNSTLSIANPIDVATTENININTSLVPDEVIDGVTLVSGMRVLVKDQTNKVSNGIYKVGDVQPFRDSDNREGSRFSNLTLLVTGGDTYADTTWIALGNTSIGADNVVFKQLSGNGVDGNMNSVSGTTGELVRYTDNTGRNCESSGITANAGDIGGVTSVSTSAGDIIMQMLPSATHVNYLTVANADAGLAPTLAVAGSDTNIDVAVQAAGTGALVVSNGAAASIQLAANLNAVSIAAPAALGATYAITLPASAPANGQQLSSDGTGQLSWSDSGGAVSRVTFTQQITESTSTSYQTFGQLAVQGTITEIVAVHDQTNTVTSHDIRIFDVTNNAIIATTNYTNNSTEASSVVVNYNTNGLSIIECQARRSGGGGLLSNNMVFIYHCHVKVV